MLNPLTHRKILKKGRSGRGTIVSMGALDRGATSFNLHLTLQVFVEGMTPYEVSDQWMVKAKDCIGLSGSIPIKVDADEPEKVAIDWDLLRTEVAQRDEQRRASLAAMGPVGAGGTAAFGGATVQQAPTPAIDIRNDPELRHKLEAVLGYELVPGSTIQVAQGDPALQMRVMQTIQQHQMEKAIGRAAPAAARRPRRRRHDLPARAALGAARRGCADRGGVRGAEGARPRRLTGPTRQTFLSVHPIWHASGVTLLERLLAIDVSPLSDAGKTLPVVDPAVRALLPDVRVAGPAYTVLAEDDHLPVMTALAEAEPGDVVVVATNGGTRAIFGELFATEAERRGLAGIVTDGYCRDLRGLRAIGLPVFARGTTPRSGTTVSRAARGGRRSRSAASASAAAISCSATTTGS